MDTTKCRTCNNCEHKGFEYIDSYTYLVGPTEEDAMMNKYEVRNRVLYRCNVSPVVRVDHISGISKKYLNCVDRNSDGKCPFFETKYMTPEKVGLLRRILFIKS